MDTVNYNTTWNVLGIAETTLQDETLAMGGGWEGVEDKNFDLLKSDLLMVFDHTTEGSRSRRRGWIGRVTS